MGLQVEPSSVLKLAQNKQMSMSMANVFSLSMAALLLKSCVLFMLFRFRAYHYDFKNAELFHKGEALTCQLFYTMSNESYIIPT